MKSQSRYHQTTKPFLSAKPTKAMQDEDAFMEEHGGPSTRAVFLTVDAIAAVCSTLFVAPIRFVLRIVHYPHPMAFDPDKKHASHPQKRKNVARHRKSGLKGYAHAKPCRDKTSRPKRRA